METNRMIVDFHSHLPIPSRGGLVGGWAEDAAVAMTERFDRWGISASVVHPSYLAGDFDDLPGYLERAAEVIGAVSDLKGHVFAFGGVDFSRPPSALRDDAESYDLRGVKLHPTFVGYNKVTPKPGSDVLVEFENGDPLLVVWNHGRGRAAAFTSDCAPHWAGSFTRWKDYSAFWIQVVDWLAGSPR